MAKEQAFNETLSSLLKGLDGFVSSRTVVGEPIHVEDTILIPLVDVQFGLGTGAYVDDKKDKGAGGMTGKMSPTAVLVIKDGYTKIITVKDAGAVTKLVDMVPDIINRFTKKDSEAVEEKIEEIKKDEA